MKKTRDAGKWQIAAALGLASISSWMRRWASSSTPTPARFRIIRLSCFGQTTAGISARNSIGTNAISGGIHTGPSSLPTQANPTRFAHDRPVSLTFSYPFGTVPCQAFNPNPWMDRAPLLGSKSTSASRPARYYDPRTTAYFRPRSTVPANPIQRRKPGTLRQSQTNGTTSSAILGHRSSIARFPHSHKSRQSARSYTQFEFDPHAYTWIDKETGATIDGRRK